MKYGILLAMGMIAATALAGADRAVNAFLAVEGDGVSIDDDGSIVCDRSAAGSVTVSARPGWLVNGRESVSVDPKRGSGLKVTSRLGEDEEHVHVFPQTVEDDHLEDIVLVAEATPASQIAMYALPDTSTVVSTSATHKADKRGKHRVTTTYYPCVCGEVHDPQEVVRTYEVEPDHYEWTASGAGQTVESSTWTGPMSKGLRHRTSFQVTGKRDVCAACTYTATTNVLVDVHELSVTNDLYLGLDRTDFGRTNPVVKVAGALIDPEPTGSSAYSWIECGICSFTGRTAQAEVRYFAPDPDRGSASYLAEPLTVRGTATNAEGLSSSTNCTTNFTVVKVDVTIDGVDEEHEEVEGTFLQYVPDTNGVISVEGTNRMVNVSFSCEPALPTNELVTVSCAGPAELYEKLVTGELVKMTSTNYPACELSCHHFKLHGHQASSGVRDGGIRIVHPTSGAADVARYTVVDVDLRAMDLFGAVDDSTEHDVGAYVHWNIDNDDSSDNTIGAPKHPGGDHLQAGAGQVVGENDLKSLTSVISPALAEGTAVLRIDKDKAKLWKNAEKGGANLILAGAGERRWSLADGQERQQFYSICSSLFVEGVGNGEGNITLSYEAPSGGSDCSDKVKYTFISANCGRQPRTDITERSIIEGNFPGLVRCEWSITGGPSKYYNCLAWAVGKTDVWVNDVVEINGVSLSEIVLNGVTYWGIDKKYGNGDGIRDIADIDSFFLAEANVVPTTSAKDATIIYYDGYHAARRMNCDCGSGCWQVFESKCGEIHRIEHVYDQLSGQYGAPARYYRPR